MRKPVKESDVTWDTVELLMPGTQLIVWSRKDETMMPATNDGMCIDDLAPEHDLTKQLWKNKYMRIEQWRKESKYSQNFSISLL